MAAAFIIISGIYGFSNFGDYDVIICNAMVGVFIANGMIVIIPFRLVHTNPCT